MPGRFHRGPGKPIKFHRSRRHVGDSASASAVYTPVGPTSPTRYPRLLQPMRWCKNGMIPESSFWRLVTDATNHILSYRPKVFVSVGDLDNRMVGVAGTTDVYRFQCSTGWGTRAIRFELGLGLDDKDAAVDPRVKIDVVNTNGGVVGTQTVYYGASNNGATDVPSEIADFTVDIDVNPGTTYRVVVSCIDVARIISFGAYEVHHEVADTAINYFVRQAATAFFPIFDVNRERVLRSLSEAFRFNGAHLLTYAGNGDGAAITTTGSTWTNFIDGATVVSGQTAGYDFDPPTLAASCRLKDANVLPVTFAAYASANVGNAELRLQDGYGTACSLTGIGNTPAWYHFDTSIDLTTRDSKLDLQFRNTGVDTSSVWAVCVYTRAV